MPYRPDWFDAELEALGGKNIFGEPNLRVVFGAEQRTHAGRFKYLNPATGKPMECWVLERWQKPEFFGNPAEWERNRYFYDDFHQIWADIKGPYPSRGAWVMICPLWTSEGQFLPLDGEMMLAIRRKVRDDESFASMSMLERERLVADAERDRRFREEYSMESQQEHIDEYYKTQWGNINRRHGAGYSISPR